jgi:hypothetical protein
LTVDQIVQTHLQNPVYIILDLSPFVLAFYAFILSKKYAENTIALNQSIKHEFDKTEKVYRFVERLKSGNIDANYKIKGDDVLGESVLSLRYELKKNNEEE